MATSREELIEEAAKAAYEGAFQNHAPEEVDRWADLVADEHPAVESWREVARQVFAVFEQAHTPTDDEREWLADWLRQGAPFDSATWGQYQDQLDFAASTIEALPRPVQHTPTDDEREAAVTEAYNAVTGADDDTWHPDKTLEALNALWGRARRTVQGEPARG